MPTLSHLGASEFQTVAGARVLDAAHASDQVERVAIEAALFHVRIVNVKSDHFTDDEAAAVGTGREIQDLIELAFEADRRFSNAWRPHDL